jgi:hypothetical protein
VHNGAFSCSLKKKKKKKTMKWLQKLNFIWMNNEKSRCILHESKAYRSWMHEFEMKKGHLW